MMPSGTLVLICGLVGAGKTTFARRLEAERNAIMLSPDEWITALLADPEDLAERDRLRDPVENLQWEQAQRYLRKGLTVILDNGFWAEEERSLYAMRALELGARIELYYLDAPSLDALWERTSGRNAQLTTKTWHMTREEIASYWEQFEPPKREELEFYDAWAVIDW